MSLNIKDVEKTAVVTKELSAYSTDIKETYFFIEENLLNELQNVIFSQFK